MTESVIYANVTFQCMGQYDRPRVLGCEPVDGVLVVLSSNEINIPTFVHQMVDIQPNFGTFPSIFCQFLVYVFVLFVFLGFFYLS